MGKIARRHFGRHTVFPSFCGKAAVVVCFGFILLAAGMLSGDGAEPVSSPESAVGADGSDAAGVGAPSPESTRFVLTRMGIIQEGIPEDRGETIFLRLPNSGGGLTVSKLDILFIGKTRTELFEFQKRQLPAGDVGSLLKLADWAGRNQLAGEAIRTLKETAEATADPTGRSALLERLAKMEYVERIKSEAVRRMGESSDSSAGSRTEPIDPERERLAVFAKEIPFSVEDRFIRKIEPILLRRCAAADCHLDGTSDTAFPLIEPSAAESFRTGHLRNLETVLGVVSFQRPETSPVLNHPPVTDENGARIWPFGEDSASLKDYELFVDWVTSLGVKMKNYTPDPTRRAVRLAAADTPSAAVPPPAGGGLLSEAAPNSDPGSASAAGADPSAELSANIPLDQTRNVRTPNPNDDAEVLRRAGYLPTETLRDEFDPAPFNRKYHPNRSPGGL